MLGTSQAFKCTQAFAVAVLIYSEPVGLAAETSNLNGSTRLLTDRHFASEPVAGSAGVPSSVIGCDLPGPTDWRGGIADRGFARDHLHHTEPVAKPSGYDDVFGCDHECSSFRHEFLGRSDVCAS
jgi:hypothetical protein